jgi:hypothetical protein
VQLERLTRLGRLAGGILAERLDDMLGERVLDEKHKIGNDGDRTLDVVETPLDRLKARLESWRGDRRGSCRHPRRLGLNLDYLHLSLEASLSRSLDQIEQRVLKAASAWRRSRIDSQANHIAIEGATEKHRELQRFRRFK